VILASEAGVLDVPPEQVREQGAPAARPHVAGRHRRGPHLEDDEVKHEIVNRWPYRKWLDATSSPSTSCQTRRPARAGR
jgi:glutamate synthase (NADPH/NADH) large chain